MNETPMSEIIRKMDDEQRAHLLHVHIVPGAMSASDADVEDASSAQADRGCTVCRDYCAAVGIGD